MEARDSGPKIRPLPVDDIDGGTPPPIPSEPRRRLLPLIVIAAGAVAFGVIARGLGPGEPVPVDAVPPTEAPLISEEPEPEPAVSTAPPPPLLRSLLPIAPDGLLLVTTSSTSARLGEWSPGSSAATFGANVTQPQAASYNRDGTRVAVQTGAGGGSMVLDVAQGGEPAYIRDASSGVWHVTNPSLFAWIELQGSQPESSVLKVADVSGFTGAGIQPLAEFDLGEGAFDLVAWGDWGFVTADRQAAPVAATVFDPDGLNPIELEGVFFDVSDAGTVLMARLSDFMFTPYLHDRTTETELVGLDLGATDFRITADGEWVLALTPQADGHTSILARTVNSRFTRLTSVDGSARIIDESGDDRYLVLQQLESGNLIFKDWNTRAEYEIAIDGHIAAIHF